jgi:glycosyltransferase involved in cell wall biosynthesis
MAKPKFAVIIPAYNAEATLSVALRSVRAQTRQDFEVVIVNDGSTDTTVEVAADFVDTDPRIRLVSQENRGPAAALNTGIQESTAELVAFFAADDLLLPTYLEEMGALANSHPGLALFSTDAWMFDDETHRVRRHTAMQAMHPPRDRVLLADRLFDELMSRDFIYGEATVRRSALEEVGSYNQTLRAAEDWEMWLRLAANGFGSAKSSKPLALYRRHARQITADPRRLVEGNKALFEIVLQTYDLSPAMRLRAETMSKRAEKELMILDNEPSVKRKRRFDRSRRLLGRWRHYKAWVPKRIRRTLREA